MIHATLVALIVFLTFGSASAENTPQPSLDEEGAYSVALVPPWTLLMVTQDTTVEALVGGDPSIVALFRWNAFDQRFEAWQRDTALASSLVTLTGGDGVWVRTTAATTLRQPTWNAARNVALSAGWSLVPWTGDPTSPDTVVAVLGAERVYSFDQASQSFVDLTPPTGDTPGRLVAHGDVVWARRSVRGEISMPARSGLRLEVVAHHDLEPDGVRAADGEEPYAGLSVTLAEGQAARYLGNGVYVFEDLAPGLREILIGAEAVQLLVLSPDDVRMPTEPIAIALETDSALTIGVLNGRLANPTRGEESAVRPFGAPNGEFGTHRALDLFVEGGTTILTPLPGEVTWSGFISDPDCGTRAVAVRGPYGGIAWILHLDEIFVELGQQIGYGTELGTLNAASADECIFGLGDHTHLEYLVPDEEPGRYHAVDPEKFLITPVTAPRVTGVVE